MATELTPEEATRAAEEAAEAARQAAEQAEAHAEAAAAALAAAGRATGLDVDPIIFQLTIFVLAVFVGYYVVWSVTPALHTPLMSVTNAISSVIVVGALIAVSVEVGVAEGAGWARALGLIALAITSVNIFGGFLVTQRMLSMYKKKERPGGAK